MSLLSLSLACSLSALAAEPPAPAAESEPLPALLQRLAEASKARKARGQNRTALVTTVAEELDNEGEVESRYELRGPVQGAPHQLRVAFKPRQPATERLVGEAVVDVQAGDLVRLQARPSKLPPFADKADFVLEYNHATPSGRDLSRISLSGEGGMLFIRKRIRSLSTFTYED